MKTTLLLPCLLLSFCQLKAQTPVTTSSAFSQDGFVQNDGQFCDEHGVVNSQVAFLYVKKDFHLALKPSGFSYELIRETPDVKNFPESGFTDPDDMQDWRDEQPMKESVCRVEVTLKGANPHPEIVADQNTGTVYNYYLGKRVVLNVPSYNRITYKDIYPGIDMVFEDHSENGGDPEYSFIVHPGANAHQIKMNYSGAGNISIEDQHTLSIAMPEGFIKETGLRGYWLEDGSASDVSFRLKNGMLSFNCSVDKNKTLIIDPSIIWGSYFGGKGDDDWDTEAEIALDHNNNVYLVGSTMSANYIATSGAVMQTYGGMRDICLAKFSLDGTQKLWGTYFGGSGMDVGYGVVSDSYNNVVITGFVKSPNVITTEGVFQDTLLGESDVVIAKFSTTGQLVWSTLMGGTDDFQAEHGRSVICDIHNHFYICGYSTATTHISTPGAYQVNKRNDGDAFLVKFNENGGKIWGTYFGGGGKDRAHALCFDPFGRLYFIGTTKSRTFISINGFQPTYGGNEDAFIAKFDTSGNFFWSTYYGGSKGDRGRSVKCDGLGYLYANGWTNSQESTVIATSSGHQPTPAGGNDGFIVKFTPAGKRVWGTYYGGNFADILYGMAIDPLANIYVCGSTASGNNMATSGALQTTYGGAQDGMMAMFDSAGHRIWGTYFGGSGIDGVYDIERDDAGMLYVAADSYGPLPVTSGSYQTVVRGRDDLAVFEFNFLPPCPDNNEPNESFQSPHVINGPITPAGTIINGSISTATDQDWYLIHLDSISSVVITLSGLTKNYNLNLFNSSNTLVASSANPGTADEGITHSNDSGTFVIQIAHDSLNFDTYHCYTLSIVLDTASGNKENLIERSAPGNHHLKIYPNPSSGLMTAEFESSEQKEVTLTVFDAIGRMVFNQVLQAIEGTNAFPLDLSDLKKGIYMVQVKGDDFRSVMKLIIEK